MLDLIVSGGVAAMPSGAAAVDIGVAGEKIVAIGARAVSNRPTPDEGELADGLPIGVLGGRHR